MTDDPIPALKQLVGDAIRRELRRHYQPGAALLIGADQPRVSDLTRGRLQRFSLETLVRYAVRLGLNVELRLERPGVNMDVRNGSAVGPGA